MPATRGRRGRRQGRCRGSELEVVDEEEAEDDGHAPGAFLASGEVSGRAMTMAMAAAALGIEQIERTNERESDWVARVSPGVSGEPIYARGGDGWITRGDPRRVRACELHDDAVNRRLGMTGRWAGTMLLDGPKCIMALEPINT